MATKQLSPVDVLKFFDTDGTPLAGGRVYTYQNGTSQTVPLATYQDRNGTASNANPIVLDSKGEATIYLSAGGVYDFVVKRSDGTTVRTRIGISAQNGEQNSVVDFGALGDASDDTAAFASALSAGEPIYVPKGTTYYALSALSEANRALLWGPGKVKVAGSDVLIPSQPRSYPDSIPGTYVTKPSWAPEKWPSVEGSITNGAATYDAERTGGYGTYGFVLSRLLVGAATPSGQFDVGVTSWVTHKNLTGGQVFGCWVGANTPAKQLSEAFTGGAAIGLEINVGNRWSDFGRQTDVGGTRYTAGLQIVPDVLPAQDGTNDQTVTAITIAAPGVVTVTAHGLAAWTGIVFSGSGTLPTGLVKGNLYYVASTGLATDTFQVASTVGGASIATTGSFSGPIAIRPSYPGTFGTVVGPSVWGHRWHVGELLRLDTIMANGYAMYHAGGSITGMAPESWTKLVGYWGKGIDFRDAIFSGPALNFDYTTYHSTTATAGSAASPGNFQGFISCIGLNGSRIKIPYFNL